MKKIILGVIAAIVVIAGLIFAHFKMREEPGAEADKEKPIAADVKKDKGENGDIVVVLDEEIQKRIGLESQELVTTNFVPSIAAIGKVLNPDSLATLFSELSTAQLALTNSTLDFERLKSLGENVSAKSLQSGDAAKQRDELALETARGHLLLVWGDAIAKRDDLPGILKSLLNGERALVRVDLPLGETVPEKISGATFVPITGGKNILGQFISTAPSIDPQKPGPALLFIAETKDARLIPGTTVTAYLSSGDAREGIVVPSSAVVRFSGGSWVYLQTDAKSFSRQRVTLVTPVETGWIVTNRFPVEKKLVVNGAQTLLSEEEKDRVQMAD